jgi:hypothetical protein
MVEGVWVRYYLEPTHSLSVVITNHITLEPTDRTILFEIELIGVFGYSVGSTYDIA